MNTKAHADRQHVASRAGRTRVRDMLLTGALVAPAVLFLAACFVLPLLRLFGLSLSDPAGPMAAYATIAGTEVYRTVFTKTLVLAFNVAVITTLLSYPAAYMLTRLQGWALAAAIWCVLFPLWISVLVRSFSWMLLLGQNGPVNDALVGTGLADKPHQFLFNSTGVYIGMVHVLLPFALLPIYSAMRAVDARLLQASEGLGASRLRTFTKVYLPLTAPGVAAAFLLVFVMGLGFYITPALLGGTQNMTVAMLIDSFVTERLVWPLAAATAFWLLFVVLGLLAVASRFVNVTQTMTSR